MNHRIQELALQAGFESVGKLFGQPIPEYAVPLEKFAELIVKECLEQIYTVTIDNPTDDWDQGYDSGLYQAAETIKEHFGVEE